MALAAELDLAPPPLRGDEIAVADYIGLLQAGGAQRADFGLQVGQRMQAASFVAYGQVVLASRSFAEALRHTQRFEGLAHDLGRSELLIDGATACYRWHSPWAADLQLPVSVIAGILVFARWLAQGQDLPLLQLAFAQPEPAAAQRDLLAQFFGLPPVFNAACTEALFPAALLQRPIASHDPALLPLLEQHAAALLLAREQALAEADLPTAVRRLIAARLADDGARLVEIAAELGLSPRTLQRRLAEAGQAFQQLLDTTRRELADAYLRDVRLSLTEIAFLLGYGEHSSFTHAHRVWHGEAPQARRAKMLAEGDNKK
jgi:AraC-like DNA-binding protein